MTSDSDVDPGADPDAKAEVDPEADPESDAAAEADSDADAESDAGDDVESAAGAGDSRSRSARLPVIALTASVALVVAAATVAIVFGAGWFKAANDDSLAYSTSRDEVARVAQAAIVTMNTLDYRRIDEGLANWAEATTGPLHDQIASLPADRKKQLADAKPVTSATIMSSAVKELDDRAGKATVIAAVKRTVQTADGKPQRSYSPMQASLTRTKDGWKLESLDPVQYSQPQ